VIEDITKDSAEKETVRLKKMEDALPDAIAKLVTMSSKNLIDHMLDFYGGRSSPRETELRTKYHSACRAELEKRLQSYQVP
jgi:hypothetical protein